ncbi:thaumatin-like protein [Amaranthus tricolor]|uniref:thaumatin-like protein n=1 Tax=Amaranthus tricolor TaxID=29722 RepID=UPI00258CF74C|nr:thaumatin-like protein [Amaranthus tricolor]
MSNPLLLLIVPILFSLTGAVQLMIVNNCNTTIWPGILAVSGQKTPLGGGFRLRSGQRQLLQVSQYWSGRIWARQGCTFDQNTSISTCQTGDCNGLLHCQGTGGTPPATLVELTFGTSLSPTHFYDVSLVDGFNLPVSVIPLVGKGKREQCGVAACEADLNVWCPSGLAVRAQKMVVGCKSPCLASGSPRDCCTGEFSWAEKCLPTVVGRLFKMVCPRAYSHPFDEKTGLKTCKASRYVVSFCPSN